MKDELFRSPNGGTLLNVLAFTADKTVELATANSTLGDPIQVGDLTVIPVSKISVGFAGGGADVSDAGKKKRQNPAGAGAKVSKTPQSFLVIRGDEVRMIAVDVPNKPSALAGVLDTVVEKAQELLDKKKAESTAES